MKQMLDENIPFALLLIDLVKPHLTHQVKTVSPCIPKIELCNDERPKGGKFRIYFDL